MNSEIYIEIGLYVVTFALTGLGLWLIKRQGAHQSPFTAVTDQLEWEPINGPADAPAFQGLVRGRRVVGVMASTARIATWLRPFRRDRFAVELEPTRPPDAPVEPGSERPEVLAILGPAGREALEAIEALGATWDGRTARWKLPFRPEAETTIDHIRRLADEVDQLNVFKDVPGRLLELAATDPDADHARRCALAVMRHHSDDARVLAFARSHHDAGDVALRLAAGLVLEDVEVIREGVAHDAAPAWLRAACGAWLAAKFGAEGGGRLATVAPSDGALSVATEEA